MQKLLKTMSFAAIILFPSFVAHAGPASKVGGSVWEYFFKSAGKETAESAEKEVLGRVITPSGRQLQGAQLGETPPSEGSRVMRYLGEETRDTILQGGFEELRRRNNDRSGFVR